MTAARVPDSLLIAECEDGAFSRRCSVVPIRPLSPEGAELARDMAFAWALDLCADSPFDSLSACRSTPLGAELAALEALYDRLAVPAGQGLNALSTAAATRTGSALWSTLGHAEHGAELRPNAEMPRLDGPLSDWLGWAEAAFGVRLLRPGLDRAETPRTPRELAQKVLRGEPAWPFLAYAIRRLSEGAEVTSGTGQRLLSRLGEAAVRSRLLSQRARHDRRRPSVIAAQLSLLASGARPDEVADGAELLPVLSVLQRDAPRLVAAISARGRSHATLSTGLPLPEGGVASGWSPLDIECDLSLSRPNPHPSEDRGHVIAAAAAADILTAAFGDGSAAADSEALLADTVLARAVTGGVWAQDIATEIELGRAVARVVLEDNDRGGASGRPALRLV
ncbi:hypothetical protein [Litorisediminicola beolgyonensis]|uniref:Uncharacterized protein n=1 Tax=Litorisediminicola beolgyonensis TaxID=1173614 RepID=A0ABW3ZJM7_9RHOB